MLKNYKFRIFILLVLLIFANMFYYLHALIYKPLDEKKMKKIIDIQPGTSTYMIGLILHEQKLVPSPFLFTIYTKYLRFSKKLQAGKYELYTDMSLDEIVRILEKGGTANQAIVIIQEGYNIDQISTILDDKLILSAEKFKKAVSDQKYLIRLNIPRKDLEGYLFPDTYKLHYNMNSDRLVSTMLNRFEEIAIPLYNKYAHKTNYSLDQIITLASIIEREAATRSEMRTISSVFHNRLKRKMPLQAEPTVRYAVKNFTSFLNQEELRVDSPYNTYRNAGLPIGPIANPGADAIEAALNPEKTSYLYFVAKDDRTHEFSYSLSQHNQAVARYKQYLTIQNSTTQSFEIDSSIIVVD